MIPFFCNSIRLDSEKIILTGIRQSTVTASSDPITEETEVAEGHTSLLTVLYLVNRMDRFDTKEIDLSDTIGCIGNEDLRKSN